MSKVRVQRERDFHPHHVLLGAANTALDDAEEKRDGSFYYELTAMTFSALALEALANSFGSHFIERWDDFENSSPIVKLRVICGHLNHQIDFGREPWAIVLWLTRLRNKIAHAKPEKIAHETIMTDEEFERIGRDVPPSKLENEVTLPNAQRAVKAVEEIFDLFCGFLPEGDLSNLRGDGWSGSSSHIEDSQ